MPHSNGLNQTFDIQLVHPCGRLLRNSFALDSGPLVPCNEKTRCHPPKPEALNVSQRRLMKTEPRPHATCGEVRPCVVFELREQTDGQTDRQTHRSTSIERKEGKEAYSSLCYKHHTATGTHVPYEIKQFYLPSGRGDIPAFTPSQL